MIRPDERAFEINGVEDEKEAGGYTIQKSGHWFLEPLFNNAGGRKCDNSCGGECEAECMLGLALGRERAEEVDQPTLFLSGGPCPHPQFLSNNSM